MKQTIITAYFGLNERDGSPVDRNAERDLKLYLEQTFEGFTTWRAEGHWHGTPEPTLVVQVIGDDGVPLMRCAAQYWKARANQDAVLITTQEAEVAQC